MQLPQPVSQCRLTGCGALWEFSIIQLFNQLLADSVTPSDRCVNDIWYVLASTRNCFLVRGLHNAKRQ